MPGPAWTDEAKALFAEASRVEPRSGEHLRRFLAAGGAYRPRWVPADMLHLGHRAAGTRLKVFARPGCHVIVKTTLEAVDMAGTEATGTRTAASSPRSPSSDLAGSPSRTPPIGSARAILRDPVEAQDATHDAFVQAWRKWPTLRDPDRFEAWFDRILVEHLPEPAPQRQSANRPATSPTEVRLATDDPFAGSHDRDAIELALADAVRPTTSSSSALRYYRDLTIEDIAASGSGSRPAPSSLASTMPSAGCGRSSTTSSAKGCPDERGQRPRPRATAAGLVSPARSTTTCRRPARLVQDVRFDPAKRRARRAAPRPASRADPAGGGRRARDRRWRRPDRHRTARGRAPSRSVRHDRGAVACISSRLPSSSHRPAVRPSAPPTSRHRRPPSAPAVTVSGGAKWEAGRASCRPPAWSRPRRCCSTGGVLVTGGMNLGHAAGTGLGRGVGPRDAHLHSDRFHARQSRGACRDAPSRRSRPRRRWR